MKCFVIMPFGDPIKNPDYHKMMEHIYLMGIKSTIESIAIPDTSGQTISCHRADKDLAPGEIISHVVENLVDSFIVIADLSDRNPNVFYELGVRHSVSNNTILIAKNLDDVPFDLRQLRTILYSYDPPGLFKLQNSLREAIQSILTSPEKIDNPVRRFIYNKEAEKIIAQKGPLGYNVTESILKEMVDLRMTFSKEVTGLRDLIQTITNTDQVIHHHKNSLNESPLDFLEGVWESSSNSHYCFRLIDGFLYAPYCYSGQDQLTGVYYNFKRIEDRLFARFKWFDSAISGYGVLKIKNIDTLVGGWWYDRDVPYTVHRDYTKLSYGDNLMNEVIWERVKDEKKCPDWAISFFQQLEKGLINL